MDHNFSGDLAALLDQTQDDELMNLLFNDEAPPQQQAPDSGFMAPATQAWGQRPVPQHPASLQPAFKQQYAPQQIENNPWPPPGPQEQGAQQGFFVASAQQADFYAPPPQPRLVTTQQLQRDSLTNSSDAVSTSSNAARSHASSDPCSADSCPSTSGGPASRSCSGNTNCGVNSNSNSNSNNASKANSGGTPFGHGSATTGSGGTPLAGATYSGAPQGAFNYAPISEALLGSVTGFSMQQKVALTNQTLATLDPNATGSTQAGWQALLHKLQEVNAPVLPPQQQGAKRGRKPTNVVNGVAIAKPVKDKKRENSILIKQLEAQLADKLNLVKGLEGENMELKRKERLLQLSVDTSEHNLNRLVDPALDDNVKCLLGSFKSSYNKQTAERVLAKIAHVKSPKDMTYDLFVSCWQALVMEMCDALMAEATASTPDSKAEAIRHLEVMHVKVIDFVMAMCAIDCSIIQTAQSRNMNTGEEVELSYEYYEDVVDKLALSKDQLLDMISAFDMFARLIERNLEERKACKEELDRAISTEMSLLADEGDVSCYRNTEVVFASAKLSSNLTRCGVLHTLLSFITLRIMNCKQTAQMSMHSAPHFPSLVRMQVAIRKTAERLGLCQPLPLTQSPSAVAGSMEGVQMGPSGLQLVGPGRKPLVPAH